VLPNTALPGRQAELNGAVGTVTTRTAGLTPDARQDRRPTKNAMNDVTSETTSVTPAKPIAFAA